MFIEMVFQRGIRLRRSRTFSGSRYFLYTCKPSGFGKVPTEVLLLPKQESSLPKEENKLLLLHVIFPEEKDKP